MAKDFEELLVWKKAVELWDAIDSVVANIPEGFEQPTDRSFAQYLFRSKASAAEVRARLLIAWRRRYIGPKDYARCASLALELGKMLGAFIKYLRQCDRKDGGLGKLMDPGSGETADVPPNGVGADPDTDRNLAHRPDSDSDPDPDPDPRP